MIFHPIHYPVIYHFFNQNAMVDTLIIDFIHYLNTYAPEFVTLLSILISGIAIVASQRLFGLSGLYLYNTICVILGNVQVLRLCQYSMLPDPVALGTVLFATTYLTTTIITEFYGTKAAQKNIYLCFWAIIITTVLMTVDLGHRPISASDEAYQSMSLLFVPSLRLLLASLSAFLIVQTLNVYVFEKLKLVTSYLWAQTLIVGLGASFLDNFVFSLLAWNILSPTPLDLKTIFMTYILGAYITRALVSILLMPTIYACKRES